MSDTRMAGFAAVPNWLLEDETISKNELLVMVALTRYHGTRGVFPSHATIGKLARIGTSTVKEALASLRERGLVSWVPRRGKDGGAVSNAYQLHFLMADPQLPTGYPLAADRLPPSQPPATPQPPTGYEQDLEEQDLMNNTPQPPKGAGEAEKTNADLLAFDEFWRVYPRKVGRGAARKAWIKAVKATEPTVILSALRDHLPALHMLERPDGDYRPHPATWLNQERWTDELPRTEVDRYTRVVLP